MSTNASSSGMKGHDRIRELKDKLAEQTEMIKTLHSEKTDTQQALRGLYLSLVKYKPDYIAGKTVVEPAQFPDLKADDLNRYRPKELIQRYAEAFQAVAQSVGGLRADLKDIYRELDEDVNAKIDEWNTLRAQMAEDNSQSRLFRENTESSAKPTRAATPDIAVVDRSRSDSGVAVPQTANVTSGGEKAKPASPVEKKKNAATLGSVLGGQSKKKA